MNPYYQEMTGLPMTREAMREQADRARDMNYLGMMGKLSGDEGMSAAGGGLVSEGSALRKSLQEASALHPDVKKLIQLGYSPEEAQELAKAQMLADIQKKSNSREGVPSGYEPVMDPETGQRVVRPMVGTKDYQAAMGKIDSMQKAVGGIRRLQKLIRETGNMEAVMPSTTANSLLSNAYMDVQSASRLAQDMGAPQAAELAILAKSIPDPTTMLNSWMRGDEAMIATYDQMLEAAEASMEQMRNQMTGWGYEIPENPYASMGPQSAPQQQPQQQPQQPGTGGFRIIGVE